MPISECLPTRFLNARQRSQVAFSPCTRHQRIPASNMNDEDPAKAFFPDQDEPDLYGALNVSEEATADEIKKSYRKLALQYHPDKASNSANATEEDKEAANKRFHQISFAYTILSDEKRRKRFDETGRTDESFFEGEADWNAYFAELWQGEVNGQTLDDFVKSYKGSDEEKADILAAYTESEGSLDALFENVMCSNVLDDEERFISIVEQAIKTKSVPTFTKWKKDVKDTKGRSKRKEAAKNEAKEAEELAKELGVHDKLFGGSTSTGKDATTDSKGGKKGKAANSKGKGKGNVNVNDEGVDEDALRALIQSRNSKQNSMNSLIEKLEAKYGAADGDPFDQKPSKGSKKRTKKEEPTSNHQEPTEEEFEALQKKLFSKKKESDGDQADEPKAKKAKKSKKA